MRALIFVSCLVALAMVSPANSGPQSWGPRGCDTVVSLMQAPLAQVPAPSYSWRQITGATDQYALYLGESQLGTYSQTTGVYRPIVGGAWGAPGEPPIPAPVPPAPPVAEKVSLELSGVDASKLRHDVERCTVNGVEVSKPHAVRLIGGDTMPDDSAFGWLVVVGPDATKRKEVTDDFAVDVRLAELRKRTRVWNSPADHFMLKDRDTGRPMYGAGNPTVVYMASDGTVLHRQEGYTKGDVGALRKLDPSYDPAKDPDLRKSASSPAASSNTWKLIGVAAVVAFLYFSQRKAVNVGPAQ